MTKSSSKYLESLNGLVPNKSVSEIEAANVLALVDEECESYFVLDEIGNRLWRGLTSGKIHEVVHSIACAYGVGETKIAYDARTFLDLLREHGLVRQNNDTNGSG